MLTHEDEERISAYLDGELSPEERSLVEKLLNDSEPARRLLAEFQEVSRHVRSPRHPDVPADLVANVLRRLAPVPAPPVKRSLRREWFATAAGLAVTGFTVMLVLREQVHPTAVAITDASVVAGDDLVSNVLRDSRVGRFGVMQDLKESGERFVRSDRPATAVVARKKGDAAVASAPSIGGAQLSDAEAAKMNWDGPSAPRLESFNLSDSAVRVPIGDLVPYLENQNGQVAVVELVVVDVEQTAGQMQMLFARNSVPPNPDEKRLAADVDAVSTESPSVTALNQTGAQSGMVALYVEAPPRQVASALNEMQTQGYIGSARLEPPLILDSAPAEAGEEKPSGARKLAAPSQQAYSEQLREALVNRSSYYSSPTNSRVAGTKWRDGSEPNARGGTAAGLGGGGTETEDLIAEKVDSLQLNGPEAMPLSRASAAPSNQPRGRATRGALKSEATPEPAIALNEEDRQQKDAVRATEAADEPSSPAGAYQMRLNIAATPTPAGDGVRAAAAGPAVEPPRDLSLIQSELFARSNSLVPNPAYWWIDGQDALPSNKVRMVLLLKARPPGP